MPKITTIRILEASYENSFAFTDGKLIDASDKLATYHDLAHGDEITFHGSKLKFDHGLISRGTITGMDYLNDNGDIVLKITGFSIDATKLAGDTAIELSQSLAFLFSFKDTKLIGGSDGDSLTAQKGDDIIIGRGGEDTLDGGRGNDRLSGGGDSDLFVFAAGYDHDVITDFVADGADQDFIKAVYPGDAAIHRSGKHDTLIDFGNGDTLTLLNINPAQIDATDFA